MENGEAFLAQVIWSWRNCANKNNYSETVSQPQAAVAPVETTLLPEDWEPDDDTYKTLVTLLRPLVGGTGSPDALILSLARSSVPGFRMYWRERKAVSKTWNSKFLQHVKNQFDYEMKQLRQALAMPKPIPLDWRPDMKCFDILTREKIDTDFAINQVQEFVMYWYESQRVQYSWNTTFLQFVRQRWTDKHKKHERSLRDIPLEEQLNDTSWAYGTSIFD